MRNRKKTPDYLATDAGMESAAKKPGFWRRHRVVLIAFLSLVAILIVSAFGFALVLNNTLNNIKKVPITLNDSVRPQALKDQALNILMLGADAGTARHPNGQGNSILTDASSSNWPVGKYRSDATMLVHITADRKKAYVISIPRDSYVKVYDSAGQPRDDTKINAALSLYGPSGAISTVENFTGLRINHLLMVDWDGFQGITDALGGVDIAVAGQGKVNMSGSQALTYVRERHNLPNGDFDRVKRQQNFLRAVMTKLVDKGTLTNPIKLTKTANSVTKNLAVDADWSTSDIRSFAFSLRNIRPGNITYLTIPTKGTASDPIAGSIVVVDKAKCAELFTALRDDKVAEFVKANPTTELGSANRVN